MRRIVALLAVHFFIACSSGTTSSPSPAGPVVPTTIDAAPAPAVPSREDCEAMVMHVVDLSVAEQGFAAAPGDREKIRAAQEPYVVECQSATAEVVACALAAKTLAEVQACQPRSAGDAK